MTLKIEMKKEVGAKQMYKCAACQKEDQWPANIRDHVEAYHLKNIIIPCRFCGKDFKSRKTLRSHKRLDKTCLNDINQEFFNVMPNIDKEKGFKEKVKNKIRFSCIECDTEFTSKDSQDMHVLLHKRSELACIECKIDSFTFKGFIKHNIKVHKRTDKIFQCEHCDFQAAFRNTLIKHKQLKHSQLLYDCEECDFRSVDKGQISNHKKLSHPKKACRICKILFPSQNEEEHMETHKVNGLFSCDLCKYQASIKTKIPVYMIKLHKMWSHSDISFDCNEEGCEYKTTRIASLKSHKENIHLQIKYTCEECGHQASTNSNLHQHKASKHKRKLHKYK